MSEQRQVFRVHTGACSQVQMHSAGYTIITVHLSVLFNECPILLGCAAMMCVDAGFVSLGVLTKVAWSMGCLVQYRLGLNA